MFRPGDTIRGVVTLQLKENYPSYGLSIGLCGYQKVHFMYDHGSTYDCEAMKWDQIYQVKETLAKFSDLKPPVDPEGKTEYRFTIEIPPLSTLKHPSFCHLHDRAKLTIQHILFAQLEPVNT